MHVKFIRKGITTYEYIVQKRARKAERARQAAASNEVVQSGIGNSSFHSPEPEPSNRLKSASTVITVTDIGMKSNDPIPKPCSEA